MRLVSKESKIRIGCPYWGSPYFDTCSPPPLSNNHRRQEAFQQESHFAAVAHFDLCWGMGSGFYRTYPICEQKRKQFDSAFCFPWVGPWNSYKTRGRQRVGRQHLQTGLRCYQIRAALPHGWNPQAVFDVRHRFYPFGKQYFVLK